MEKTKFTKTLAFKTMLRLFVIFIIVSLLASVIVGTYIYVTLSVQMRDYTYNASLKGSTVATINELTAEDIDRYLKTGKTDEKYTDLLLNFLLINDNYELQRCDIFVPYEDHITYLISTDDETIGESLNKTASYYGEEKKFVSKALEVSPDTEFIPEKSARESLYTDNVKVPCHLIFLSKQQRRTNVFLLCQSLPLFQVS